MQLIVHFGILFLLQTRTSTLRPFRSSVQLAIEGSTLILNIGKVLIFIVLVCKRHLCTENALYLLFVSGRDMVVISSVYLKIRLSRL